MPDRDAAAGAWITDGIEPQHVEDALRIVHEAFARKLRHGFRDADDLVRLFHDSVERTNCHSAVVDGRCLGLLTFAVTGREFYRLRAAALFSRFSPWRALRMLFNGLLLIHTPAPDEYYVESISVAPAARGSGLGAALMRRAEEQAVAMGKRRMSLNVIGENEGAIRLYERLGYRITRTQRGSLVRLATGSEIVHRMEKPLASDGGTGLPRDA